MTDKTIRIMLTFVRYATVVIVAFWLGQKQVNSSEESIKMIEPSKKNVDSLDGSANQRILEKKVAELTHDLKQIKQYNHEVSIQLESATADLKPIIVNDRRCDQISKKLDLGLYGEAYQSIYSTNFATREKSLKALALLEIPEAKATLMKVVSNEQENVNLRRDLIRSIDWHDAIAQAVNLLQSEDESVRAAIILASQDSNLNKTEQEYFENELMGVFNQNNGDFIQIAAVDYFANKNPSRILEINVISDDESVYSSVTQHMSDMLQY
jgi:hypothetical protein